MPQSEAPTIALVAERAEVSVATVSYVLNGRRAGGRISEATRQRVLDAVDKLGYVPNQAARTLRTQKTERVCLAIPNIGAPLYHELAQDFQTVAEDHQYTTLVTIANSPARVEAIVAQLQQLLFDGVLFFGVGGITQEQLDAIARAGVAVVVHDNTVVPNGFDVIRRNDDVSRRQVIDYVLAKGHRRVGLVGPGPDRLCQYREELNAHGIKVEDAHYRYLETRREAAYHYLMALAEKSTLPDVFIASADVTAIGLLMAANQLGITVPDALAIIGHGNLPETAITVPSLTTVGTEDLDFTPETHLLFERILATEPLPGRVITRKRKLILRGSA